MDKNVNIFCETYYLKFSTLQQKFTRIFISVVRKQVKRDKIATIVTHMSFVKK